MLTKRTPRSVNVCRFRCTASCASMLEFIAGASRDGARVARYSELRKSLKSNLDRVCEDHVPLRVKRQHGSDVVILSEEDYDAIEETIYLLRSPANARRIQESLTTDEGVAFENAGEIYLDF